MRFMSSLLTTSALVGLCGAAVLTLIYRSGRLGQMMFVLYAVLFAALAVLGRRQPTSPFSARFSAALLGFCIATAGVYTYSYYSAAQDYKRRFPDPRSMPADRTSLGDHAKRVAMIIAAGAAMSAIISSRGR
ncbi:MAG: hypothetical protein JWM95_2761 [Gemmatimonadetes bacterium]|nr:hypothetical protein [Gemmatimonadota bacterium]